MARFKTGMLVRVKDQSLIRGVHADTNREYVAKHGYLWIVASTFGDHVGGLKSIATGEVSTFFHNGELEAAEEQTDA